jgi:23S rRNA (guanine2445-N2)-methyltransferase / 23S rRNA (guanine2069-N7)-methyltransferase
MTDTALTPSTLEIAPDLANRLQKNLRKLKAFIKSGQTNAYRVYDADIPEYAIAIDRYGEWLHVQEYAAPSTIEPEVAEHRLQLAINTLPEVLGVPAERIVLKQRRPQKGLEQYQRLGSAGQSLLVHENGAKFRVNLVDYLDTGLFLDHRPMRSWMQQNAKDKRVLNLFCYTGAVSVHAALGGAARVDSVDMSATYLDWAEENFRINKLPIEHYRFIQDDVTEWLPVCPHRYDIIFLDPPTFSNSKRMRADFDVQRDQVWLINQAMQVLNPKGTLVFSNNFRRFKLDPIISERYQVTDYHQKSLPIDFERNPKIHTCWFISKLV